MSEITVTHCGYIAIIGRPNVGKSTLLNRILGEKLSITSHKPQTTRHQILGIKTTGSVQAVYVDTPGLHRKAQSALNRVLNRVASQTLEHVDVIVFMVEAHRWTAEDEWVLGKLADAKQPVILVINKVDYLKEKSELLPYLEQLSSKREFAAMVPIAAKTGNNVAALESVIHEYLPENAAFFPEDQLTDRSDRFLASELLREKLTRYLHRELPYSVTIEIEKFTLENKVLHIGALIWVEREGQKKIVIGEKGEQLKKIGRLARIDMEKSFGHKVFLQVWVKVKENWADNEQALRSLGYNT